ncbi:helix-turn-helix domain-containing protein [Marinobacter nanhaiticus D15-8W]|uniref:Helix-turn-helix domain-containing protein n=1 Tax=Marinobacter nanhaiticus D15-8W TaxID=626887 RepID=N6WWF3_9GAMM|nr:helix-turn-helix domain-containing protein [Marinobacter nanhaiticus D15-8W]
MLDWRKAVHQTAQTPHNRDIVDALRLAGAAPRRVLELDGGRALALWHNQLGEARYERPRHHALSIYTRSGEQTTRQVNGRAVSQGFPGAVCLFPAGSQSQWKIAGPFEFVHLYFNELDLRRCAEQTWDCEPDHIQLAERYQVEDDIIAQAGKLIDMGDWNAPGQALAADHLTHWLLVQIVSRHASIDRPPPAVAGTLAPKHRRLLQERIEAQLDQPLNLATLAGWVNLSPYHFARLFRASFGCAPYQYLQERRLTRARDELRQSDLPVTTIAMHCGFNDASQFSRAFRKRFGITPSAYRISQT